MFDINADYVENVNSTINEDKYPWTDRNLLESALSSYHYYDKEESMAKEETNESLGQEPRSARLEEEFASAFKCEVTFFQASEGQLDAEGYIFDGVSVQAFFDQSELDRNISLAVNLEDETAIRSSKDLDEFLGKLLAVVGEERGFRAAKEYARSISVEGVHRFIDAATDVVNGETTGE